MPSFSGAQPSTLPIEYTLAIKGPTCIHAAAMATGRRHSGARCQPCPSSLPRAVLDPLVALWTLERRYKHAAGVNAGLRSRLQAPAAKRRHQRHVLPGSPALHALWERTAVASA